MFICYNTDKKQDKEPSPPLEDHSNSEDEITIPAKKRKRIRLSPISDASDTENKGEKIIKVFCCCSCCQPHF